MRAGAVEPGAPRHLREREQPIGALDAEDAGFELDVRRIRFQQLAGDPFAFEYHFVGREPQRRTAGVHAALGISATAMEHLAGVPLDETHLAVRHAEPLGRHLRERRLVALPGRQRAGVQRERAVLRHADLHALRLAAGALAVHREADASALAAPLALGAPASEALPVGERERLVEHRFEFAGIEDVASRRSIGELRDEVSAAQIHNIHAELARRFVEQPLGNVGRLGLRRAPIRPHRTGVGEARVHHRMDQRDVVGVRVADRRVVRRDAGVVAEIGAEVDVDRHAQGERAATRVERELGFGDLAAAVHVGRERFGARRGPFDRTTELARRPEHDRVLGIHLALHAEGAADIGHDDAQFRLRHAEDRRQDFAQLERGLRRAVERPAALFLPGERRARLDRVGAGARIVDREPRHAGCARKSAFHGCAVAAFQAEAHVVARFVPDLRSAARPRVGQRDGRQRFVLDVDQLGRIGSLRRGLGNDQRHGFADIAHLAGGEDRLRRPKALRHIGERSARQRADALACYILARQDEQRAAHRARVDVRDARMCVR